MKDKISVVIIEDNSELRGVMEEYLSRHEDIEVAGTAGDGNEGLDVVMEKRPDVILLDLIMPNCDGFEFCEKLDRSGLAKPEIIVVSAVGQDEYIRKAIDMGARFYILKPYDMDVLVKRIRELIADKDPAREKKGIQIAAARSLEEKITSIFLTIGIPAHIKGYVYLREAIKMVISNKDLINKITKELYPGVAEICGTTPSKVERAIRHAIEVAFSRGRIENINQVFGINIYSKGDKPTNGEFIALIADKISLENSPRLA